MIPWQEVVIVPDDGSATLKFHGTKRESHTGVSVIPTHALESGAKLADHIRDAPAPLKLDVIVEQLPRADLIQTPITIPMPPPSGLLAAIFAGPPPSGRVGALPGAKDYIGDAWAALEKLRLAATTCIILTSVVPYYDVALERVELPREFLGMVVIALTFQRIRVAGSETVAAPQPAVPAGPAAPTVDKGGAFPTLGADPNASTLSNLLG